MNEPRDPNETRDEGTAASGTDPDETTNPTSDRDLGSLAAESLEVGLAAAFGKNPGPPRSSIGDVRPVLLKEAAGESALVVRPTSDAMPSRDETGDRYQLSGEIARGGMGAVLRGRDVDLGRDLAVKVLLEKFANRPDIARRFIEEAQIGGQLQHPGVVPVYDIGKFGDRQFFTMKLVKGQTLSAIVAERTDPAADRPRLLGIASQVAQAMAYAHAKGVIHRDLKPANIMVGAFGEVQVMDWGLAKVLAEGGIHDEERASRAHHQEPQETVIRTARSTRAFGSFGAETEAGSVLGTPAYMPPEQASGDIPNLDRRADVFALGAILCEIMTGTPPYLGRSNEEVRRKAANGDLADATARLDACGADPELVALTKQCLSAEAIDRPKDAQVVVDALTSYLDGVQVRLQKAERERAVAEARELEERKRRKVQLALAASVLAMMLGIGAFAFWRNEQVQLVRQRDARNAEAVAGLLGQAEESLRAGDAAKAAVALEAAKKRSAEGGAEKESQRLGRLNVDLALLRDLDAVDQFRWTFIDNKWPDDAAVATRTRDVLKRFGADPDAVSVGDAAALVTASVVRERIVPALDRLLRQEKSTAVRAQLKRVDVHPYRDLVRDSILAGDPVKMREMVGQQAALEQPPGFVAFLGQDGEIPVERRRQLLQTAVIRRPSDLGLLMTLGGTYQDGKKESVDEMLRWYQAALAAAPANFSALFGLALALNEKGQQDETIACYKKAIELEPKIPFTHNNLGIALEEKGQVDEAIACFKTAIELDTKDAKAHSNLGLALKDKGQLDEAIASYKKAIELDPKNGGIYINLGNVLKGKGQMDEAIACYKKAVEVWPTVGLLQAILAFELMIRGELDEAIACGKKAVELAPNDVYDVWANSASGNTVNSKGDSDNVIARFEKAIELDPKLAWVHYCLGIARFGKGKLDEAIASFKMAIELDPRSARAHGSLGAVFYDKGQLDEAIASYKTAIELDPKHAEAHCNLGAALKAKGQLDDAIACYNKAIELDAKNANARNNLGAILCDFKWEYNGAIACFKKAIELDPKNANAHSNLDAILCDFKRDYDGATACFRKAIELDPQYVDAHLNLGNALMAKGELDEAIASYKTAIELDPNHAMARNHVARTERLIAARDKLPLYQHGTYTPANNAERLALAEWCKIKKLNHTAAGLYAAAFAAEPWLADDLKAGYRYNAAGYAALAAADHGDDAAKLEDNERTRLRHQALDWLRADLALRTKRLETLTPADRAEVQQILRHWHQDTDLAGIRDAAALAKLPADEQKACTKLWADVAALSKEAEAKPK